jgi:hypothetical protein
MRSIFKRFLGEERSFNQSGVPCGPLDTIFVSFLAENNNYHKTLIKRRNNTRQLEGRRVWLRVFVYNCNILLHDV